MSINDNERPVASGLDEVFGTGNGYNGRREKDAEREFAAGSSGTGVTGASGVVGANGADSAGGTRGVTPAGDAGVSNAGAGDTGAGSHGADGDSRSAYRNRRDGESGGPHGSGEQRKNRSSRQRRRGRSKYKDGQRADFTKEADSPVLAGADGFGNADGFGEGDESVGFAKPQGDSGFSGGGADSPREGEVELVTEAPATVEVVGIRFKNTGKVYYFAPGNIKLKKGDSAIVETARGTEYGFVSMGNSFVPAAEIVPPLRDVIRRATEEDSAKYEENLRREKEAFGICLEKIRSHGLEMKLIDAEYTFDQSKLTFYFSAEGRVDFRELVKDLASVFRTRIELRQIGIRDEAKLVGGLGVCGRPFCCATFLSDFVQVSIKMAKEQNLSLNSAKISGACGRLMCCLRYEHETYEEEIKKTPPCGSRVKTADGIGTVVETAPLRGKVKVKTGDEQNFVIREYDRNNVTVLPKNTDGAK